MREESEDIKNQKEEATTAHFCTHRSVVLKYSYLHTLSTLTLKPEKALPILDLTSMGKALPF